LYIGGLWALVMWQPEAYSVEERGWVSPVGGNLMKRIIVVAVAAALCGAPALAADMAVKAPPPPPTPVPVYSWTGFYIGGDLGDGRNSGNLRADYLPFPGFGNNPTIASSGASGIVGGVFAGYN
jgi:outer membrane immunogenic protein